MSLAPTAARPDLATALRTALRARVRTQDQAMFWRWWRLRDVLGDRAPAVVVHARTPACVERSVEVAREHGVAHQVARRDHPVTVPDGVLVLVDAVDDLLLPASGTALAHAV